METFQTRPPHCRAAMFAELHCTSAFTFLTGASQPEELVLQAQALGYRALAITDECSFAGIVRAHQRSEEHTSELQSRENLVCRLLLEKKNTQRTNTPLR